MYEEPSVEEKTPYDSEDSYSGCGGTHYKYDGHEDRCWCASQGARM